MMQEFMIEFSYTNHGERKYRKESLWAETAQDAVNKICYWYDYCVGLRIEKVYRSRNRRWEETEAWK